MSGPVNLSCDRDQVAGKHFDVVVIGGGITGAGVARHAALAGLSVLVLEAYDFASGTSSRSTKLIHGGLRYLAMGDIKLVRETVLERAKVFQMAPHLAEPAWMLIPTRNRLQLAKFRLAVGLYERLGKVRSSERHIALGPDTLSAREPLLDTKRYPWGCLFREYVTDDARLVLSVLRGAVEVGALARNYARVVGFSERNDGLSVTVEEADGSYQVHGSVVVNATGPWVETLLEDVEESRLHLSKGVHIVLPSERVNVANTVYIERPDGRPVFAIPRGHVTYVGTTDESFEGDPEHWPPVSEAEVQYLLDAVNDAFDIAPVTADDVVASWSGLRPLIKQAGKKAREMSRKDEIWINGNLITLAGGKLTGFRKMAEDALTAISGVLGKPLSVADPLTPLPGGDLRRVAGEAASVAEQFSLEAGAALRLVRLYGSEVAQVLADNRQPIADGVFASEVDWAIDTESAQSLEDIVYRRMRLAFFEPDLLQQALPQIAERASELLGWDEAETKRQLADVSRRIEGDLRFI
ncbi:MAG: glycerol-3-phosphate dehydrogenase/oxidase [Pseudomonadaceae bacterium]|nr:glycerol-3-phosphate dehydrogenase/oxidase [Pseudomonadaceae bacterium]